MILYSWGTTEGRGEMFLSPASGLRAVVVLERAEDADGSWHVERRDPFADYRRAFNRAPKAIVAVGVATDTDQIGGRAPAEGGGPGGQPRARPQPPGRARAGRRGPRTPAPPPAPPPT